MKLFHLSDLHLGKRLNEFSMTEDQEYILKQILRLCEEERPDGVIVAGDIYDRSVPSEDAMKLWDSFLISLSHKGIPVYAISGNHDSAIRFSDHGALIDEAGIHFSPVYDGQVKCCRAEDEFGAVNIYLLPFIKPAVVRSIFPEDEIRDHNDACRIAVDHIEIDPTERNILVAHQFVTGAVKCDSEEVVVGGMDNVDASVFDKFDYVALGHIHGKQTIGRDTVRYCGTPLKYSFSEKDHVKSITVINLSEKGSIEISEIPLHPRHDLRQIRGTYAELTLKTNYEGTATDDYIHAVLTDENDVPEAMGRLRVIYPNLMSLTYDNKRTREHRDITDADEALKRAPIEVFGEFFEMLNNQPMSEEQEKLVSECISAIWGGE